MKFYDCQSAPSPRRVRIFVAEKGLDIPVVQVDLRGGQHLLPEFRAINPYCTVPVLELDNGVHLIESVAICRYLEEIHPEPPLMGVDPVDRAVVEMLNRHMEMDGFLAVAEVLRNSAPGMKDRALTGPEPEPQIPELADRGRRRIGRFFRDIERIMSDGRPFIAGQRYTVADITAQCAVDFAARIKIALPDDLEHAGTWYRSVSSRPSAQV